MGRAANLMQRWWPCVAAALALWSAVGAVLAASLQINQGRLIYALDDSYIHMAMAKNLARHGVWGVTPFGFTASSSAPLWTLLVAGIYRTVGVRTSVPLILNLLLATLLLIATQWVLTSIAPTISKSYAFIVLLAVVFFSPLLNLIFLGLEHILHTLLTLLFVFFAARTLADEAPPARRAQLTLIALGVAVGAVRYEGLFAVAAVCTLLFLKRRRTFAIGLAACSLTPAFIMGVISVGHGWFWLPNPVVLKGNLPMGEKSPVAVFLAHAAANTLYSGMRVVRLEGVALLLLLWRYARCHESEVRSPDSEAGNHEPRSVDVWMMGIFVAAATLHMLMAGTGWFLRYEAYLVALGLTVVAVPLWGVLQTLRAPRPWRFSNSAGLAAAALLAVSASLFWHAGYNAAWMTLPATHDTFRWHYQMGTFVHRYYQGAALVVNDIGAVDFLADIHLTDPHGLADRGIARARLRDHGQLAPEVLDLLARSRGARVALVDENWVEFVHGAFRRAVPGTWLLAGVWKFPNRVVLAPAGLSFYALDEAARRQLIDDLRNYAPHLPPDVEQSGSLHATGLGRNSPHAPPLTGSSGTSTEQVESATWAAPEAIPDGLRKPLITGLLPKRGATWLAFL